MPTSPFIGELLGSLVLLLLGNGVVANVLLKSTKGHDSGWIVITTAWGLAVAMGIFTANAFGSADAHINPAVTLADAVITGDYSKIAVYIPAQMLGSFLGAVLVWLHYIPHWGITENSGDKLGCFATAPAIRSTVPNLLSEMIGTMILIIGVTAISKSDGISVGLGPYMVGLLVWSIGLSLGGTTGYAINPARDLAPRLAHALLPIPNKGSSDWSYSWIPIVGPLLGAALIAIFLGMFEL
jgi:glycerol uptake facilitator protein